MRYKASRICAAGSCLLLLSAMVAAEDEAAATFTDSLKNGEARVSLRYRLESVSDGARQQDALASTLRTTLSYRTEPYKNWTLFAEAENVSVVGDDSYSNAGAGSLSNAMGRRPVVADPALTEFNQAYLRWKTDTTQVTAGRQEILLGDLRFVGSVGWRQNHQSFDALSIVHSGVEKWTLSYSFLAKVNRIFGDSLDLAAHLANAKLTWDGVGALTLYGYLLDYDDAVTLSTSTFGAEFSGKRELEGDWSLLYEIEAAHQSDSGDNRRNVDADYWHGSIGGARGKLSIKAGLEVLGSGPGGGQFLTPLATLHKFNGWADKFLVTPAGGLEDLYLAVSGSTSRGLGWTAVFHDFGASEDNASYGQEVDLLLTYKAAWGQTLGLKGALYDADTFAADTDKWMLWTAYSF